MHKMKLYAYFLVLAMTYCQIMCAQVTAKTSGSCNTAIAGSSGNKITISCMGVSGVQAEKLTALMNRILSQHMDFNEVNSKLDQISSEVNSLNEALNPLVDAPQPIKELIFKGNQLRTNCTMLQEDWAEHSIAVQSNAAAAMQAASQARLQELPQITSALQQMKAEVAVIDQKETGIFLQRFSPRLEILTQNLQQALPYRQHFPDYHTVNTSSKLQDYIRGLKSIPLSNLELLRNRRDLYNELENYLEDWREEIKVHSVAAQQKLSELSNLSKTQPAPSQDIAARSIFIDNEYSQRYAKTIEPALIAWRNEILQAAPSLRSNSNFGQVRTSIEIASVCGKVQLLLEGFQTQMAHVYKHH